MPRLKCKKCGNVFEQGVGGTIFALHIGPFNHMKCPACGKSSWFNIYSSVKDAVTYPSSPEKTPEQQSEKAMSEEELEQKRIEESKYEKP